MTPTERIGELVAAALQGKMDGRALQQAIGEHLGISGWSVNIDFEVNTLSGVELVIRVPA